MWVFYPGLKMDSMQSYTVTHDNQIFFITHDEFRDQIRFDCLVDFDEAALLEQKFREFLTNGNSVLY